MADREFGSDTVLPRTDPPRPRAVRPDLQTTSFVHSAEHAASLSTQTFGKSIRAFRIDRCACVRRQAALEDGPRALAALRRQTRWAMLTICARR